MQPELCSKHSAGPELKGCEVEISRCEREALQKPRALLTDIIRFVSLAEKSYVTRVRHLWCSRSVANISLLVTVSLLSTITERLHEIV